MFRAKYSILFALLVLLLTACGKTYEVPADATPNGKNVVLYPDYTDVTVPPNIAPLNFMVKGEADEYGSRFSMQTAARRLCLKSMN